MACQLLVASVVVLIDFFPPPEWPFWMAQRSLLEYYCKTEVRIAPPSYMQKVRHFSILIKRQLLDQDLSPSKGFCDHNLLPPKRSITSSPNQSSQPSWSDLVQLGLRGSISESHPEYAWHVRICIPTIAIDQTMRLAKPEL